MTNKPELTDGRISNATLIRLIKWAEQHNSHYVEAALRELQERRETDSAEPVSFDELNAAVAEVTGCNPHAWDASIYKGHQAVPFMNYNSLARIVDKYRTPPAPVSMKDHQIRELVNDLRDIAIEYHGTQQLRERIAHTVRAAMLQGNYRDLSQPVDPQVAEYEEIMNQAGNSPVTPDGLCPCCGRKPLKHIKCSVPGCGRKHVAHGLCQRHYDMKRREDPEQVEKFREANRRFTAKKRAQKTSAPQQEVK